MQGGASADPQRGRRPVNMISFDFDQFNFKLSPSAQVWTCASSLAHVLELTAGTNFESSSILFLSSLASHSFHWFSVSVCPHYFTVYSSLLFFLLLSFSSDSAYFHLYLSLYSLN